MQPEFWNDKRPAGVLSEVDLQAYTSVVEVFERIAAVRRSAGLQQHGCDPELRRA